MDAAPAHDHLIAGHAADALASLAPAQLAFLKALPKAELHAHLNGSIPLPVLQQLARDFLAAPAETTPALSDAVRAGVARLQQGVVLNQIDEFFGLFPAIYALTSAPPALATAARAVLAHFLDPGADGAAQAAYLELRSTPRETEAMTRARYIETVLDEVERYPAERAALIVSLDRRMSPAVAQECVEAAIKLRKAGRRVVGVDLCGDPRAGNMALFAPYFAKAKAAGLGLTLHIAEIEDFPPEETRRLLSFRPDRLGHATFLDEAAKKLVHEHKTCIEICLSSNLICKTVPHLDVHHIRYYLRRNHPINICTDDILPFRNSLLAEYAILMAPPPLGLGLTESEIEAVARMGMECRFRPAV
ncbi:Metallo-dependent hydrolase [Obba rivulosa]|uniref:Metallo-dependent hydrolase n=1 Tax=Obba rivulosa TaxID=1052685 RepID=A0A8E2J430_9APHY|nr:Metallo-dependent hydrolase [Obba rivulosa]